MGEPKSQISVRVSRQQMGRLQKLQEKLCLDRSSVVNLAIKRLADAENVK